MPPAVPTSRWLTLTPRTSNLILLFYIVMGVVLVTFMATILWLLVFLTISALLFVLAHAFTRSFPASSLSPS